MNRSDARHPLFNREFRYLWIGNTVSGCGDQFFLVALPWLILQLIGFRRGSGRRDDGGSHTESRTYADWRRGH